MGFNQTKYDVSEQDVAKLCVVLLQGNLTEDVSLQVNTHSGSANGQAFILFTIFIFVSFSMPIFMCVFNNYVVVTKTAGESERSSWSVAYH